MRREGPETRPVVAGVTHWLDPVQFRISVRFRDEAFHFGDVKPWNRRSEWPKSAIVSFGILIAE